MIMENTRFISLSEDIDPMLWVTSSDAYNDLAEYAYQRVEMITRKKGGLALNEELAGDIVITACSRAFKYSYRFDPEIAKLHNWFNKIISNTINDYYKKNSRHLEKNLQKSSRFYDSYGENSVNDLESSPEETVISDQVSTIREEVVKALNEHIDTLKPLDKEIFISAFVDDIPYKVIAEKAGMTETAARKRAFDIKNRIKKNLDKITAWDLEDIVLYNKIEDGIEPIEALTEQDSRLFTFFPQYDVRDIDPEEDLEYRKERELCDILETDIDISFNEYFRQPAPADQAELFTALQTELKERGRKLIFNEVLGPEFFTVDDALDIVIEGSGNSIELRIGFIYRFLTLPISEASAASVADFIMNIHNILDESGEEIDAFTALTWITN